MFTSSIVGRARLALRVASWVVAAYWIAGAGGLHAADVSIVPSADALVFAGEPISNYGGAGQLSVSDAGRPQGEYQTLMRFDLGPAKSSFDAAFGAGNWRLESATLRLSAANPNNPLFNPSAAGPFSLSWVQNDAWVEGTGTPMSPTLEGITYATLPTFISPQDQGLGTFAFAGGTSGTANYALNVGSGFSGDLEAGGLLSMRLFAEPGTTVAYNFSSRSFQTVANRPLLTLTASEVPEPSGMLAMVIAAAVLRRSRRHSR